MTVCYFGIYNADYSSNKILISGLEANGVRVLQCCSRRGGVGKYIDLIRQHRKLAGKYDFMIVGFPGQTAMILAKFLTRRPIVFNVFTSLYDSLVFDRREVKIRSVKAVYLWLLDYCSCFLAHRVILDTEAHIDYFSQSFKIKKNKFIKVFVGSDDKNLYPIKDQKNVNDDFVVHFHGSLVPLQGVDYILKAANILRNHNIKFNLIGSKIKELFGAEKFNNINFIDNVPYNQLKSYIAEADICLGIFGDTPKALRVIPNKVYEAIACAKPVITADTPATRELLLDGQNVIFCRLADGADLAKKILWAQENKKQINQIGCTAYSLFKKDLVPTKLVKNLLTQLKLYER